MKNATQNVRTSQIESGVKEPQVQVFVGLDVHKESISVAVAHADGSEPRYVGKFPNDLSALMKALKRLGDPKTFAVVYEAGCCGYALQRQLKERGILCKICAPSRNLEKPVRGVKTDRLDACSLARELRDRRLSFVWAPDQRTEALRKLSRLRETAMHNLQKHRQEIRGFLLALGVKEPKGQTSFSKAWTTWVKDVRLEDCVAQALLKEMLEHEVFLAKRLKKLEEMMEQDSRTWELRPAVDALMGAHGVGMVTAVSLMAELGDVRRFPGPKQVMRYLGLTPSENSSGGKVRRGRMLKDGSVLGRRLLLQLAHQHRRKPSGVSPALKARRQGLREEVTALADKMTSRLCKRYQALDHREKSHVKIVGAIARESAGHLWAIAMLAMALEKGKPATA